MKFPFTNAKLFYMGNRAYPVDNNEVTPFIDFDTEGNLDDQVFRAMALMSNACGGHTLSDAKLRIGSHHVSLIGHGFNVMWGQIPGRQDEESIEEFAARHSEYFHKSTVKAIPYQVRADQYGAGWTRAIRATSDGKEVDAPMPAWHSGERPSKF